MKHQMTTKERLIKIETLLENHLKHHEWVTLFILCPILVAMVVLTVKTFWR